MIEQREVANVKGHRATWPFFLDDDGDRTAFDTFAEANAAPTGQPGVRESLQHRGSIILQQRFDLSFEIFFGRRTEMTCTDRSVAAD